ncbi:MAG: hypothetical protein JW727_03220 [Candidatus Aenigmarchaeota archaeon]|nr:hypothetical protein [Candidatus Aenigmarchaeota archaeon]
MSILRNISSFVKDARVEESLSAILKQKLKAEKGLRAIPKNYFYVTHAANPAKFYWEQKHSQVEKTDKVNRKLLLGKRLERIANSWFRSLPDFSVEEGVLDGVWVDIPGVRGSVDYRIGESIVEFKTKDALPEGAETILEKYPQDLEQLCFYSILHPDNPKENYLVFMNNTKPYQLRAFKITILDHGRIKTLLKGRLGLLKKAIAEDNSSMLGRCRYYESGCEYCDEGICECSKREPLSTDSLRKAVEISFDEKFTSELEKAKNAQKDGSTFSIRDVIAPRKAYLAHKDLEDSSNWTSDPRKEEYLASLGNVIRKLSLNPTNEEIREVAGQMKEKRLRIPQKWMKLKSSGKENGEIVPYLVKVSSVKDKKQATRPGDYHLTELAITCAAYGKSRGMIFAIYPEMGDSIRAYEVTFNNINGVLKYARSILDSLEKAIKTEDLSLLHPCPQFMSDGGKCPLLEQCSKDLLRGCVATESAIADLQAT